MTKLNDEELKMFIYGYCYRIAEEMQSKGMYEGMETIQAMKTMLQEIIYDMEDK